MVQALRNGPTAHSPAEGWREYKRFYIGTLLMGCKAPWLVARVAIAAIVADS